MTVWMIAPCIRCGRMFGFNPRCVPTSAALIGLQATDREMEPLCRTCFGEVNLTREVLGFPPRKVPDGAYGPAEAGR